MGGEVLSCIQVGCDKLFSSRASKSRHITLSHSDRPLKWCPECDTEKLPGFFYKMPNITIVDGVPRERRRTICDDCHAAKSNYGRTNRPESHKRRDRKKNAKLKYGLTLEQYDAFKAERFQKYGGKCEICRVRDQWALDHCHTTGTIRGMLCRMCNVALGSVNDNVDILHNMIDYLSSRQKGAQ